MPTGTDTVPPPDELAVYWDTICLILLEHLQQEDHNEET